MNHFQSQQTAERYFRGRPDFHAHTIQRIKTFLALQGKVDAALDIACGTGLSTKALLPIASHVYGTDSSEQMIHFAKRTDTIHYSIAEADNQPFPDNTFDLVTVCSGVHWFNIDNFLREVRRIVKSGGWLVLYDNFFIADMPGQNNFRSWFTDVYMDKFPAPTRNNTYDWSQANLQPKHLEFVHEETFTNPITYNKEQLALYFTTQSNIIDAIENRGMRQEEIEGWLENELLAFFDTKETTRIVNFGNWIKYIQRT